MPRKNTKGERADLRLAGPPESENGTALLDHPEPTEVDRFHDDGGPPLEAEPEEAPVESTSITVSVGPLIGKGEIPAVASPESNTRALDPWEDPAWKLIHELSDETDAAEALFMNLDKRAKAAKKAFEAAAEAERAAVRKHKERLPIFDGLPNRGEARAAIPPPSSVESVGATSGTPGATAQRPSPEDWQSTPIQILVDDHGLPKRTATAMEEGGIRTVGDLATYTGTGGVLTDLKGIGESAAEKIFEADTSFWAQRDALSQVEPVEESGNEQEELESEE